MPQVMKAAVVHSFGKPLVIQEMKVPTPGPGEVLVKIVATGVCHTDLHAADVDWPVKPVPPFIPGHEGTGYVAALGPGVTSLKEGDPVAPSKPVAPIIAHPSDVLTIAETPAVVPPSPKAQESVAEGAKPHKRHHARKKRRHRHRND